MAHVRLHVRQAEPWPALPLADWQASRTVLHMWTQIVGKVRLALTPPVNHWWHAPLYVGARGLTTSLMPLDNGGLQIDFDFFDHSLIVLSSDGRQRRFQLPGRSVAGFYRELMSTLYSFGVDMQLHPLPVEVTDPVPFPEDNRRGYDAQYVQRFWRILMNSARLLAEFRGRFLGKASPVHFYWGSFDLAVSLFSGRPAPVHPSVPNVADSVTREAYSHEIYSAGFWPGTGATDAAFYAYVYPEPAGFADAAIRPDAAGYDRELGEFLLPYQAMRTAADPERALLDFLESSYEAAAGLAGWDRAALERHAGS